MPVFHPADGMTVTDGPVDIDGRFVHYPLTVRHTDMHCITQEVRSLSDFPS